MRVFGIDPGSRFMGYGVVERVGRELRHVGHGIVRPDLKSTLEQRLRDIFGQLQTAIALYRPQAVAVEGVFTFRNARSALILGHARGVALLVAAQFDLPVHEYSPAQVKRAVGAGGAAAKTSVATMVGRFLKLDPTQFERADASDALAVALCHAHRAGAPVPLATRAPSSRAAVTFMDRVSPSYKRPETRR